MNKVGEVAMRVGYTHLHTHTGEMLLWNSTHPPTEIQQTHTHTHTLSTRCSYAGWGYCRINVYAKLSQARLQVQLWCLVFMTFHWLKSFLCTMQRHPHPVTYIVTIFSHVYLPYPLHLPHFKVTQNPLELQIYYWIICILFSPWLVLSIIHPTVQTILSLQWAVRYGLKIISLFFKAISRYTINISSKALH